MEKNMSLNVITKPISKGYSINKPLLPLKISKNTLDASILTDSLISSSIAENYIKYNLSFVTEYGEIMGSYYYTYSPGNSAIKIENIEVSKDLINYKKLYKYVNGKYNYFVLDNSVTEFVDPNKEFNGKPISELVINSPNKVENVYNVLNLSSNLQFECNNQIKYKNSKLNLSSGDNNVIYTIPQSDDSCDIFTMNYKNDPNFIQTTSNNQMVSTIGNGGYIKMYSKISKKEIVTFKLSNKNIKKLSNVIVWTNMTSKKGMPLKCFSEILTDSYTSIKVINDDIEDSYDDPYIYYLIV